MNDQNTSEVVGTDERPLGNIALSLSGGGGRAAGFHLGTLAYLDRVDLLKDVAILSSVSGGSHVAAKYALTLKTAPEEEPLHDTFRGFYKEFFGYLMHADLVRRVFKKLCEPPERESSGRFRRRNAVLALADIYDELENFMNGARFDVFWGDREIHLKEIILNTTEFKTGFAFRFHKGRISRQERQRLRSTSGDLGTKSAPGRHRRHIVMYSPSDSNRCFSRKTSAGRRMNRSCALRSKGTSHTNAAATRRATR